MTTVGDNYFLDKDKFTMKIGDSPMQQAINFFETKMASCCGVKKNGFVGDREISFNVSSRYDAFVENMCNELDKVPLNTVDIMCHSLKPNNKLPRKLKKAYKKRKKWALAKVNKMCPIFSLKNCTISCDVADGKDYSSEIIYDLIRNKVISIKTEDFNG